MVISSGYHSETICAVYGVPASKPVKTVAWLTGVKGEEEIVFKKLTP